MTKFLTPTLLLAFSLSALGQGYEITSGKKKKGESVKEWGAQEVVLIGELKKLSGGRVGQGSPPTFSYRLELTVKETLRGTLTKPVVRGGVNGRIVVKGGAGKPLPPLPQKANLPEQKEAEKKETGTILQLRYYVRQEKEPEFPEKDAVSIIALEKQGSSYKLKFWEVFDEKKMEDVRLACSLPMGWRVRDGKVLSPWADLKVEWPEEVETEDGEFICSVTGRPALDWNSRATMTVSKIPSVYQTNFNRDGDGEIRLKISNFTKEPVTIPVLRRKEKRILWKESLVILVQNRTFRLPGSKGIGIATQPVTLAPSEGIATTINPLRIRDADWPSANVLRMNFRFCLGKYQVKEYFTYYKQHHDAIRAKLLSGQPLRPEFLGD